MFRSIRSGQCPYSCLFILANTHISVCSVWQRPIFQSLRSDKCPFFVLFGLTNTHISVCSVWPIPIFRSVRSDQYPYFGLFSLANTTFWSARFHLNHIRRFFPLNYFFLKICLKKRKRINYEFYWMLLHVEMGLAEDWPVPANHMDSVLA